MNLLRERKSMRCFLERWKVPALCASITKQTLEDRLEKSYQLLRALPSPEQS